MREVGQASPAQDSLVNGRMQLNTEVSAKPSGTITDQSYFTKR
jgi:hypothetical protein